MTPIWRNFAENTATVQFDHRILALTTLTSITGMYTYIRINKNSQLLWKALPSWSRVGMHTVMGVSWMQVGCHVYIAYVLFTSIN